MTRLSIPGMSCGHCKAAVERAVASVDPDAEVTFDMAARQADVRSDAGNDMLIAALRGEGYEAAVLN